MDFRNLPEERWYHGREASIASKLADLLFTRELALRLRGSGGARTRLTPA
ncbi:MAG: hypothetical protein K6U89_08865 [Chloroflexi bacterium]|nr:hypothetical protein [Chloroflexota bacterium]